MVALSRTILGMPKCRHRTIWLVEGAGGTRLLTNREEGLNIIRIFQQMKQAKEEQDQEQMAQSTRIHKLSMARQKMN